MKWCIRQLWCPSIIFHNITSIAHVTNILISTLKQPQVVTWGQQMSALDQQAVLDKTVAAAPPLKERALKVYSTYIFNVHRTIRSFSDRREVSLSLRYSNLK